MYTWNYSSDDENWGHDIFETEQECLDDAKENYDCKIGDSIAIGTVNEYIPSVDIESILEDMQESAYDNYGEGSESWNVDTYNKYKEECAELEDKINTAVKEYLSKTDQEPNFYSISEAHMVEIK